MNSIAILDKYIYELCRDGIITRSVGDNLIELTQKVYDEAYTEGKHYKILKVVKADE
jgi:hypothetical protein